jgi:hypothetical protein
MHGLSQGPDPRARVLNRLYSTAVVGAPRPARANRPLTRTDFAPARCAWPDPRGSSQRCAGERGRCRDGGDGEKAKEARLIRKMERPRLGGRGRWRGRDGAGLGCFITCRLPFYQIQLKAKTHRTHIHIAVVEKVLYELEVPGSIPDGDEMFFCYNCFISNFKLCFICNCYCF